MINNRGNSDYIDTSSVDVLNCRRLPARLTIHQVAEVIKELLRSIERGIAGPCVKDAQPKERRPLERRREQPPSNCPAAAWPRIETD